jgi:hypothetical protein
VTLTDLPQPLLHDILGRLPSSAEAVRTMGVCKALAAAVRALPEVSVAMVLDLALPQTKPLHRTRQAAVVGTLTTATSPVVQLLPLYQRKLCCTPSLQVGSKFVFAQFAWPRRVLATS